MSIIKEKIKYNGLDLNFNFNLDSKDDFLDYQQEIDTLTQVISNSSINSSVDQEVRRFKISTSTNLNFYLYNITGNTYANNLYATGFNSNEIQYSNNNVLNSFFILDFYDSIDINTQNRIFTSYMTIINQTNASTTYILNTSNSNQFCYLYVPLSYINIQTGSTITGYTKFSFYNAKTGSVKLFYNQDNGNLTNNERMLFKTILNLTNKTWSFNTTSFPNIYADEEIKSTAYINRINAAVPKFNNKQQLYPTGNTFNYKTGTYLTE
jgi:hypothetical protein